MDLKILLPHQIFAEIKNVSSIVAETSEGSFGLLPQRLDCVAALVPSIFMYETDSKTAHYLAVDEGVLVKAGSQVMVSVRNAFGGTDLGKLHESVENEFKKLDDRERDVRSTMAKIENGFLYNLEKFIRFAIDSVLNQTVKPLQIIVIDDCSTDISANIIASYGDALQYHKMQENSGVLRATIEGMKYASGDIVCFLDGDDVWMPEKIEETVKAYQADESIAMVTHHYTIIDANGMPLDILKSRQTEFSDIIQQAKSAEALSDTLKSMILKSHYVVSIGSAYSVSLKYFDVLKFEQYCIQNFSDDVLRKTVQDLVIADYLIITNPDKKVTAVDKKLFQYRVSESNSSGQSNNLPAAIKSLKRHKSTTLITSTIVKQQPRFKEEIRHQLYLNKEADYVIGLYQKKYLSSVLQFFNLAINLWDIKKTIKEFKRLGAVIVLGPEGFFKLKSKNG